MIDKQEQKLIQKLDMFLQGNIDAVRFCKDLIALIHVWDDLIDRDVERTDNEINDAFRIALIEIPSNPFYRAYQNHFIPLIMNCILQWEDANKMEAGDDLDNKKMAWMLRASVVQIISYCAFIIGGMEWSRKIGVSIREMYEEKLEDFLKEVKKCQTQ